MFIDEKELEIRAGKGGDGVALFRREIYVPHGGPDGGDGGTGGDIHVIGRANLHALTHLGHIEKVKAEDGQKGGHRTSTGRSGSDEIIYVPLGTVIEEQIEEGWKTIGEIQKEGDDFLLAKGGNGGWGNWHFKSSIQQAPERFNTGLAGEHKHVRLTLKLIADVGLIGLPNCGKSTFLSVVSAARPKIANYPFTTLEPQLGVAEVAFGQEKKHIVIADLPGLIEGASHGKGLGIAFLKHVERTKLLFHFIDSSQTLEEIETAYQVIRTELVSWSPELATRAEVVVLSKTDLIPKEELQEKIKKLEQTISKKVYPLSAVAHQGIVELLQTTLSSY